MDDLFLAGDEKQIVECKKKLAEEFEMKDLGLIHYFLGLEVWKNSEGIFLNQGKYVVEILKIFDILECKAMATPMDSNQCYTGTRPPGSGTRPPRSLRPGGFWGNVSQRPQN